MHKDIKEILYTEEEIKAKCDELAKQIDQSLIKTMRGKKSY